MVAPTSKTDAHIFEATVYFSKDLGEVRLMIEMICTETEQAGRPYRPQHFWDPSELPRIRSQTTWSPVGLDPTCRFHKDMAR